MHVNPFSLLRSAKSCNQSLPVSFLQYSNKLLPIHQSNLIKRHVFTTEILFKFVPDKSKVPVLNENDIEEQFVQGSGPGGQNVNRLQNCVVLRHIPTGIVVRCHEDRLQQRNRKLARQLLVDQLDQHYNGEFSLHQQKKRYEQAKLVAKEKKAAELRLMKKQYKESLNRKNTNPSNSPTNSSTEEEAQQVN